MTTEELIIGHFDGTLSTTQESELQSVLASSPEARSLYDTHRGISNLIASDAAATEPSEKLNRRVLAASLMAIPETIAGGAATAWFTMKVVGGISAAVFGGLAVVSIVTSNVNSDNEKGTQDAQASTPAVRRIPTVVPSPPPVIPGMEEASQTTFGEEARLKQASGSSSPQRSTPRGTRPAVSSSSHASSSGSTSQGDLIDRSNATQTTSPPVVRNPAQQQQPEGKDK